MEKCICGEMDVWSSDIHHRRPESVLLPGLTGYAPPSIAAQLLEQLEGCSSLLFSHSPRTPVPQEGEEFFLVRRPPSPRQRCFTGPNGLRGLGLQAAAWLRGGSASSMDSLYVEEVAASLVREFLSRKVMAVHSEAQETALMVGGSLGFPTVPLHLRRWGSIPPLLFSSDSPKSAPFSAIGKLHFPEASPS